MVSQRFMESSFPVFMGCSFRCSRLLQHTVTPHSFNDKKNHRQLHCTQDVIPYKSFTKKANLMKFYTQWYFYLKHVGSCVFFHSTQGKQNIQESKMCQRKRSVKAFISLKHSFLIKHHSFPGVDGEKKKTLGSLKHHSLKTEGRSLTATQQQISFTDSHEGLEHAP